MLRHSPGFVVGLWWLAAATPVSAQLDDIRMNGFVSQGYLNTSGNDFLVVDSKKGTAEFNEMALVVTTFPSDRLRIGAQIFARDFGTLGNNQVVLDWAFGDYHWKDELGVRVGKVRLPWGFYNQVRDVDAARDQIFLPQSLYGEWFRDFLLAYEGGGIYGHVPTESAGSLEYEFWGGTFNVPDVTEGFWEQTIEGFGRNGVSAVHEILGRNSDDTFEVQFSGFSGSRVTFPWAYGASLIYTPPIEGLRVGATALRTRVDGEAQLAYDIAATDTTSGDVELFRAEFPASFEIKVDGFATVSAEYALDRWVFAAEYEYEDIDDGLNDGWYGMVSCGVTDQLALSTYYSEQYQIRNNRSGRGLEFPATAWHKDFAIGLRYDFTDNWRVKYEHHFVDGLAIVAETQDIHPSELERKWSYFALKSTFHF